MPTTTVLEDRHQHPTTTLPLTEIFWVFASLLAVAFFWVLFSYHKLIKP